MRGDGDGWVVSDSGAAYWGRHGAAGLLLRAPRPDGSAAVLLQHRAPWSHQGGTWGLPGGARDSHETAEEAAIREAHEEAGPGRRPVGRAHDRGHRDRPSGSHWTYTTVIADAPELLETVPNRESAELRWVAEDEVAALPLHPGFAASWTELRAVAATIPLTASRALSRLAAACGSSADGDRPNHDDAARARVEHLGQPLLVDAADREPGLGRPRSAAVRDQRQPGRWRGPASSASASTGPTQK